MEQAPHAEQGREKAHRYCGQTQAAPTQLPAHLGPPGRNARIDPCPRAWRGARRGARLGGGRAHELLTAGAPTDPVSSAPKPKRRTSAVQRHSAMTFSTVARTCSMRARTSSARPPCRPG